MADRISRISVYKHVPQSPQVKPTGDSDAQFRRLLIVRAKPDGRCEVEGRVDPAIENLRRSGWQVSICASSTATQEGDSDSAVSHVNRARFLRDLYRMVGRADIVQIIWDSNNSFLSDVFPSILMGRFQGKRVVVRCTGDSIEQMLERWGKIIAPVLRNIDSIVVSSKYMVDTLARYGLEGVAIPPMVDVSTVKPRTISNVQPKLLCMRPLEPDMNVACAIRAHALVKQKYPRTELVIAGDGPLKQELEQAVSDLGISGISFVGAVDGNRRRELLDDADILLNSSSRDDMPSILVDAMAAGLPIVTTDAGGIPELVSDHLTGMVAAIGDHVGLAGHIIDLIENPQLTETLSQSGKTEAELYTWARLRHRWLALYTPQVVVAE